MKKTLYSTTVLAAAGLLTLGATTDAFAQAAAPAAPERLKISVGGFMNQYVGYVDQDKLGGQGYKHFDQKSDSELYFTGSLKLDNGITVSVVMQLEADTGTATGVELFDESYMRLDTGIGQFRLGQSDAASLALQVNAPYVGINAYNGDQALWIYNPADNNAGVGSATIGGGDDNRVYYVSPAIAGFRVGGSYAANTTEDAQLQPAVSASQQTDVSVQWAGSVGDFAVRASAGYWWNQGASSGSTGDNNNWQVGADVTFADFTFGAGYREQDSKISTAAGGDFNAWNVGLVYKPGPWSAGITYQAGTGEGSPTVGKDDKVRRWTLGATYSMGPGVELMTNVLRHSYEDESNVESNENKAWAVIGGVQVAF